MSAAKCSCLACSVSAHVADPHGCGGSHIVCLVVTSSSSESMFATDRCRSSLAPGINPHNTHRHVTCRSQKSVRSAAKGTCRQIQVRGCVSQVRFIVQCLRVCGSLPKLVRGVTLDAATAVASACTRRDPRAGWQITAASPPDSMRRTCQMDQCSINQQHHTDTSRAYACVLRDRC